MRDQERVDKRESGRVTIIAKSKVYDNHLPLFILQSIVRITEQKPRLYQEEPLFEVEWKHCIMSQRESFQRNTTRVPCAVLNRIQLGCSSNTSCLFVFFHPNWEWTHALLRCNGWVWKKEPVGLVPTALLQSLHFSMVINRQKSALRQFG